MGTSECFHEITDLQALLHYVRTIGHKPSYHPVLAIPSQNPFKFRNRLRPHAGLVPKLTDRWSDRRDRANRHLRKSCWRLPAEALSSKDVLSPAVRTELESTVIALNGIKCRRQSGKRGN
jgi:hypothetical protein